MSKQHIQQLIQTAIQAIRETISLPAELPAIQVEPTKDKSHGDYASNIALVLAKSAQCKPRDLAEKMVNALPVSSQIKKVEIAGPGFINFFLSTDALHSIVTDIWREKENYGRSHHGQGKKIIVEYVSSNPTGPLHVGHGRHAAYGAVVSDLLETIGYSVFREYYVNDAGRQMDILTASTWLRYLELCGEKISFPSNAYKGDYVIDIARSLQTQLGQAFYVSAETVFQGLPLDEPEGGDKEIYIDAIIVRSKTLLDETRYETIFDFTLNATLSDIRNDLSEFGVNFQNWFSERAFVKTDAVDKLIHELKIKKLTYERDGALWFRSTDFNDDKDRVLQRSNGQRTYYANDFAYHINKFARGFEHAIDIFGSDHHGYIPRMKAGLMAQDIPADRLSYLLVQFVTLYRSGQQVQMSTRSGSFVTLRELREEVGNDAARYFYVMRKCEQHIDFDLDLAKTKSNENPVYYIQYAHARICSVFRQMEEKGLHYQADVGCASLECLIESHELQLLNTLGRYRDLILNAAEQHEPHLLTNYLRDLAADFHAYYNSHQFLVDDEKLLNARLALILATRQVLRNGLKLLGISTPESM
jgi:arginyl-tRNA synthetase